MHELERQERTDSLGLDAPPEGLLLEREPVPALADGDALLGERLERHDRLAGDRAQVVPELGQARRRLGQRVKRVLRVREGRDLARLEKRDGQVGQLRGQVARKGMRVGQDAPSRRSRR